MKLAQRVAVVSRHIERAEQEFTEWTKAKYRHQEAADFCRRQQVKYTRRAVLRKLFEVQAQM